MHRESSGLQTDVVCRASEDWGGVAGKAGGPSMGEGGDLVRVRELTMWACASCPDSQGTRGQAALVRAQHGCAFQAGSKDRRYWRASPLRPCEDQRLRYLHRVRGSQDRWSSRLHRWLVRRCVDLHVEGARITALTRPNGDDEIQLIYFGTLQAANSCFFWIIYRQRKLHTQNHFL